ncbi:MAG: phosphatidylserine decarboxylase family protein [Magnetococcales bacterium]|nr:phosphatidylserine decarboxylase family protein [Magnetococcales bacterium]
MPVAREGLPFIALFVLVAGLVTGLAPTPYPGGVCWVLALWCIWFFRDPDRVSPQGPGLVVAPADGKVIVIEEVAQAPLTGRPARKISIFMNVFSVHVNRLPESGTVRGLAYHPGRFFNAALDKASLENERMAVHLATTDGRELVFVQVAGLIARRIVCRLKEGDRGERGQRFGLIRFGSRVDCYLPLDARVQVTLGDQTRAGESVLAQMGGGS